MNCPSCSKKPIAFNAFLWKPSALKLSCTACGAALQAQIGSVFPLLALAGITGAILGLWCVRAYFGGTDPAWIAGVAVAFVGVITLALKASAWRMLRYDVKQKD